jgi:hypothetical protein
VISRSIGTTHSKVQLNPKGRKPVKEFLPHTSPTTHYHISAETQNKVDIANLLDKNEGDPALEVCIQTNIDFFLPMFLLCRTLSLNYLTTSLLNYSEWTKLESSMNLQMKKE